MPKILVIKSKFAHSCDASSQCLRKILKALVKNGFNIDIVTSRVSENQSSFEVIDGCNVFSIDNVYMLLKERFQKNRILYMHPAKWYSLISDGIIILMLRLIRDTGIGDFKYLQGKVKRFLRNKIKESQYQFVVGICLQFEAVEFSAYVKRIKGNDIKFIIIQYDPYAYNKVLFPKTSYRAISREQQCFEIADKILVTPELYTQYLTNEHRKFINKIDSVALPNLYNHDDSFAPKQKSHDNLVNSSSPSRLVFCGLLYYDIRNPYYLFELFTRLKQGIAELHLYGGGCEEIVEAYIKANPNDIINHGWIPADQTLSELTRADILINIGNRINNQTPSKIFDYISTGKPIINIYSIFDDTSKIYIDRYPLALELKESFRDINAQVRQLEEFIINNTGKQLTFEEATARMQEYTYEHVMKQYIDVFS